MKEFITWRYLIISVLFTTGLIAVLRMVSDPVKAMCGSELFMQQLVSFWVAAGSFGLMGLLIRHWVRTNKVFVYPEDEDSELDR